MDRTRIDPTVQQWILDNPGCGVLPRTPVSRVEAVTGMIAQSARNAACVVLEAKGNNTLGARLGSTAQAVLHHDPGNVVVAR